MSKPLANPRLSHLAILFIVAFLVGVGGMFYLREKSGPGFWPLGVDIYSNWLGARLIWHGENPYTDQVSAQIQQLIYGRQPAPGETEFRFFYPAYLAVILLPILVLPASWAAVVWCATMWAVLFTLSAVWSWSLQPRPAPLLWGFVLVSSLLFRPALSSIVDGQYSLFVIGCLAAAWWLSMQKSDYLAGMCLMFATIKPSIGLFAPIPFLLWAMRWKRWRIVIGFCVAAFVLMGFSILQIGWWVPDLIYQPAQYLASNPQAAWSPASIATLPGLVMLACGLGLLTIGLLRLWRANEFPSLAIIGALYLNLMLAPHTVEYDLTMLLISLFWLGTEWLSFHWGVAFWLVLIWLPWLSWFLVMTVWGDIATWWRVIWQFYPNILLFAMLLEWWRARRSIASAIAERRSR